MKCQNDQCDEEVDEDWADCPVCGTYLRGEDLDLIIRRSNMCETNFSYLMQAVINLGGPERIKDEIRRRNKLKDSATLIGEIYGDDPLIRLER